VLHQVGVSFDLYYDAQKHKIKIEQNLLPCITCDVHYTPLPFTSYHPATSSIKC